MALSTRDRRAVYLGGGVLALIAAWTLVIEPAFGAYDRLVTRHQQLARQVSRVEFNRAKADYYRGRVEEFAQQAGLFAEPKPYAEQVTTVAEQILTAAQQSGVQLKGATPTTPGAWADDPSLSLARFHIDAEVAWPKADQAAKAWENIFKFTQALYRTPGVLSIEQLELNGEYGPGNPNDPNLKGKITVRMNLSVLTAHDEAGGQPW